ncbi:MAG: transglycosylase domain-containing protein, partial [Gemmatimonadales bacterium]
AAMISAPNRTSAARHPDAARERRDMVLHLMADQRRISRAVADRAVRTGLTTGEHPTPSLDGRYFRDYAASNVPRGVPARGGAIYTTLDPDMQRAAEHAVAVATARWRSPDVQVAVVAIDPRTGDVLAMVGGRDYGRSQFNRATEAERQPGSAFKPIVALAALDPHNARAAQFTLATTVADEPLTVNMPEGPWQPADYDQGFRGPVTVREAMEQSLNVPFARIGMAVGPDRVVSLAKRMGITSPLRAVPSIALGSSEVTLLELARAYGVLANEGNLVPTRTILAVSVPNAARPVRIDTTVVPREIVDSGVAYLVTSALEGVVTHGTGHALNQDGRYGQIAGKTGTSNDWRDAWFMTYTPDLVVGVWVGFDDGRSLRMPGATAALPVAATFLAQVTPDGGWPDFERPDGIVYAYAPAGDSDEIDCGRREVFLRGTAPPSQGCSAFDVPALRQIEQWSSQMEERAARWLEHMARQIARQGGQ